MTDHAIRNTILTLLGQDGRAQLAREMGMPDSATAQFIAQSEQDQCAALLREWKSRDSEASFKSLVQYAIQATRHDDEEDDGENDDE